MQTNPNNQPTRRDSSRAKFERSQRKKGFVFLHDIHALGGAPTSNKLNALAAQTSGRLLADADRRGRRELAAAAARWRGDGPALPQQRGHRWRAARCADLHARIRAARMRRGAVAHAPISPGALGVAAHPHR